MLSVPDLFEIQNTSPELLPTYFKNGALIDSQVLALLVVGLSDFREGTNYLPKFHWSKDYLKMFDKCASAFGIKHFVITPHTLTEFIHKLCNEIDKKSATELLKKTGYFIKGENLKEIHVEKEHIIENCNFQLFGVSDLSVNICHNLKDVHALISRNQKLCNACKKEGKLSINFDSELMPYYLSQKK